MTSLDEFATMAVADVRAEAAQIADTEAALAGVRSEVQLVAAALTSTAAAHNRRRRFLTVGAAAAACVAVVVAAMTIGGSNDRTVRPTQSTPTAGEPIPSMSSPIYDETTGSQIVFQFTRQWEECDPTAYCLDPRSSFIAPLVTSDGRILLGETSARSPGWLIVDDGNTTRVPIDPSWRLRDAAMAPDDTVYAMFTVADEAFLYRYDDADMSSPVLVAGPERLTVEDGSVSLDTAGKAATTKIDYDGGMFFVRRPMNRPQGAQLPAIDGDTFFQVDFLDGTSRQYNVLPGGDGRLAAPALYSLQNAVVLIQALQFDESESIIVMLPDGTMRERVVPLLPESVTFAQRFSVGNEQRFVDEGYLYLLTAETTSACCTSTTAVFSVRRFALPTADEPPVVVPSAAKGLVSGTSLAGVDLGTGFDEALPMLQRIQGDQYRDESAEYTDNVDGKWFNDDESFSHRFMRQLCWEASSMVCAVFGGESVEQLHLVGWWSVGGPNLPSPVYASSGLALGMVPADFGIEVTPAQGEVCNGLGRAETDDGIQLDTTVIGTTVGATPAPADIVVTGMSAGEIPQKSGGDC
jgi:hypothetical protein